MPGRLLVYTHALAGGGAERVCALLASGFSRRDFDVTLVVDHETADNAGFLDPGVKSVVLGPGHLRAVWRLSRLVARDKPDVTLSAIGVSNLKHSLAAALAGRLRRAVLSIHAFAGSEPEFLSRIAYWATPILSRITGRTVAVSHGLRADLVHRRHAAPARTIAIQNPVMVGDETQPLPSDPDSPSLVLAAGRLAPGKDMRGLVQAFRTVADRRDVKLVILGEGPERPAIEADIAALGLQGRVELPGYVATPWDIYRKAACFVTASRAESFSMVVAEALRYGLPVVAVDSAGPREILADGVYGALVPAGDRAALADAIVAALDDPGDPDIRRGRGAAFSVDAAVDAYQRLFDEVIREAR